MMTALKNILIHPLARDLDIDSPEASSNISEIIKSKPFLKKLYVDWYKEIVTNLGNAFNGRVLELGSGSGFFKQFIPGLITSEILTIPRIDIVLDGQCLPVKNGTLDGVVMVDVFHHIPDVGNFFTEMLRCLKPGGKVVMIEPWVTRWSRIVYEKFHHEPFLPDEKEWQFPKGGALTQSNQALPWIVFDRDIEKFYRTYKGLTVENIRLHTPLLYLLSGGVSLRSLMPGFLYGPLKKIEDMAVRPIETWAMFATITLLREDE